MHIEVDFGNTLDLHELMPFMAVVAICGVYFGIIIDRCPWSVQLYMGIVDIAINFWQKE